MTRKLGWLLILLFSGTPVFCAGVGSVSGYVKDSSGAPQLGAAVEVFTSAATLGTTVFTNAKGFYSANDLQPGIYQIKVTAGSFLPSLRQNVEIRSGARLIVNVTVSTLTDALKLIPPKHVSAPEPDDWHWTLRSTANRPILRALDSDKNADGSLVVVSAPQNPETSNDRAMKARVAFIAGPEADGFGGVGDMTTAFALEKSLFTAGTFSFDGNIGTSGDPSGILRASYSHDFGDGSKPNVTVTYRRFAPPGLIQNSPYDAIDMNSSDRMSIAGFIDLAYGADLQSLDFARRVTAVRPYGSVDVHVSPDMVVEYRYATAEPDTRAAKGFDTAPADLSESGPRMTLANGVPDIERARHQELSISKRMGKTNVQVAGYLDHVNNLVLTGAGDPSSYSDDVLTDIYSGTFSYAYNNGLNTSGARVVVERTISDDLTASVDYSTGDVVTAENVSSWQSLPQSLGTGREHALGGKITGKIPGAHTSWIASYKWTSGRALSAVDAFNASPGQADPYLSIFIRQPLPETSFIPARIVAMIDFRNLLAQGYVPVMGMDGRTIYMVQSARSLRAGLAFTF